jgi:predicted Rossmann fold flavoprotein
VLLLERTRDGGRKILISGGGRCNILPSVMHPAQYVTDSSPHIVRNILRSWPLDAQRRFFEHELDLPLALEAESGKLFPASNKAREVRDGLVRWVRARGGEIAFGVTVLDCAPAPGGGWVVQTDTGPISAARVIVATGGLSVPQTGSDGTGLRMLAALGHTIHPTYPALTPLTLTPPRFAELAGVSVHVTIESGHGRDRFRTRGGFLFTHRGYSGPAVLNASHLLTRVRGGEAPPELRVCWGALTPDDWERELTGGARLVGTVIRAQLPERLAERLLAEAGVPRDRPVAHLKREERAALLAVLTRFPLPCTGDEGYRKAEVTGGGVALGEIVPATMESRLHPGLHICGEALDCFGPIGGYNFLWAWVTGRAAGMAADRAGDRSN